MVKKTGNVFSWTTTGRHNGSSRIVRFVDFGEKVYDWSAGEVGEKVE